MRRGILIISLMLSAGISNAGVLDGLRELRGTVGEVTRTNREIGSLSNEVMPTKTTETQNQSGTYQSGDVLVTKIANVKVYREASKKSPQVMQVSKSDEIVYMGEEQNGLFRISSANGEGWVDKLLVKKH